MKSLVTFFVLFSVLLMAGGALAAPFNPAPRKIDNGGDSLTVIFVGDERFFYVTTESGELLVQGEGSIYYYADQDGLPTKVKARDAVTGSRAKARQLRPSVDRSRQMEAYRKLHSARVMPEDTVKAERAPWVPTWAKRAPESGSRALLKMGPPNGHEKGKNRFPVFLVEFGNKTNRDSLSVYSLLNAENYTAAGSLGSVRDYFRAQSLDVFEPNFDLYLVKANVNLADYINKESEFIKVAIDAVRQKYTNFDGRRYDANNDGYVDMLCVLHAGGDFTYNNNSFGGFHYQLRYKSRGNVGVQDAGNNKKFDRYLILSQEDYLFAAFLHEFSHGMGLKDHYCVHSCNNGSDFTDSPYQAPGVHYWDVMATGMYADNSSGKNPPGYSAFERNFMGWLDYIELEESSGITAIPPLNTENVAYKVRVPSTENEWFVLENRQLTGWDAKLPNHGLLVWHIDHDEDAWFNNTMNDDPAHQRVDVIEAGTVKVPSYSGGFKTKYFTDDPFPGSSNVTELSKFPTWVSSVPFGLYSITEKDGIVCLATQKGVKVDNCVYSNEPSSSSEARSSSSAVRSSSSAHARSSSSAHARSSSSSRGLSSSSGAVEISSSSETTIASPVPGAGMFRLWVAGSHLHVEALTAGEKVLQVFDLQGNLLVREHFAGESAVLDLARFGRGARIVRVSGAGVSAVRAVHLK